MSATFRKSLFGFNSDDVMAYIQKSHKEHTEKETVLSEKVEKLNNELSVANANVSDLSEKNAELEAELKNFKDKYDEIERLAQNIGKLYVVANANANAIMQTAKENQEISENQVEQNLNYVNSTQASLLEAKEKIENIASDFSSQLEDLLGSLNLAKHNISINNSEASSKIDEYEQISNTLK